MAAAAWWHGFSNSSSHMTDLPQLLVNAQVVHHHDTVDDLKQRLVCDWLIWLLLRSPQQQAVVSVAPFDCMAERRQEEGS